MSHTQQHADRWLQLILRQALPGGDVFASHVAAGQITSLCTCGCHGFEFSVTDGVDLSPLTHGSGLYCELAFQSNLAEEIDMLLFTDARGYFCGADVMFGQANTGPMPDDAVATALLGVWPSDNLAGA